MAPDPIQAASPPKPDAPPRCKYRVRFRKAGELRLVSHHDLMHVFERMFRRADLLLCVTQGFNPRPKMAFASSLALGVAGLNEVLEFELASVLPPEEVERRMARQCPPGIEISSVRAIDIRTSAFVRRGFYRLGWSEAIPELAQRCDAFLATAEYWIERPRPRPRRINIRPFVHELHAHDDHLDMALWITPNGAARPEEVLTALGLQTLLEAGAVIERTDLEICDELPPGSEGPPRIVAAIEEISANDRHLPDEPAGRRAPRGHHGRSDVVRFVKPPSPRISAQRSWGSKGPK